LVLAGEEAFFAIAKTLRRWHEDKKGIDEKGMIMAAASSSAHHSRIIISLADCIRGVLIARLRRPSKEKVA
jgi:hypothetical protein